jgi:AcrR family transcriptional regulator
MGAGRGEVVQDLARRSRPALNRDDIVATALRVRLEHDARELSMRRLATALDVTPMALYRHFDDKDDILVAMTDALLAAEELPSRDTPWPEYLRALVLQLRALLAEEPVMLQVATRQPLSSPAAQRRVASATEVLVAAGFSPEAAVRAYATTHTYTLGFCAVEHTRGASRPRTRRVPSTPVAEQIAGFVSEAQFFAGLDVILAGIAAELASAALDG